MKLLILTLLIFSNLCFADYYVKKSELNAKLADCEYVLPAHSKMKPGLIAVPSDFDCKTFSEQDEMIDDEANPNWGTRSKINTCDGEDDCVIKSLDLDCTNGRKPYYNAEYSEVWCNKILSYTKKKSGRKIIAEDSDKKEVFNSGIAIKKAEKDSMESALELLKEKLKNEDLNLAEINMVLRYIHKRAK